MLHHETPHDYLLYCRQAIKDQKLFIEAVERRKKRHLEKSLPLEHKNCSLCDALDDCIKSQLQILTNFEDRYRLARKGIYE